MRPIKRPKKRIGWRGPPPRDLIAAFYMLPNGMAHKLHHHQYPRPS